MKRVQVLVLAFVVVCLLAIIVIAFVVSKPDTNAKGSLYASDALSESINHFGFKLYNAVDESLKNGSFVYSPLSVSTAFGMVMLGTRRDTEKLLFYKLSFNETIGKPRDVHKAFDSLLESLSSPTNYTLYLANKVLVQQHFDIKSSYKKYLKTSFKSSIDSIDFMRSGKSAVEKVNHWVADQTNDKIKTLLTEPLDEQTKLVLLNAIYFKAQWTRAFNASETVKRSFRNRDGSTKQTMFMYSQYNMNVVNKTESGYSLLEIDYSGNISFIVVLPNEINDNALPSLMKRLTISDIEEAINSTRSIEVKLFLPKFKLESEIDLKEVMTKLGVGDVFKSSADFTGISPSPNLCLSKGVHKAVIDVNEEGSEAAAATGLVIEARTLRRTVTFDANHPFLFLIRNNDNRLLYFMGAIQRL